MLILDSVWAPVVFWNSATINKGTSFHPLKAPPWPWFNYTLTASCMHLCAIPTAVSQAKTQGSRVKQAQASLVGELLRVKCEQQVTPVGVTPHNMDTQD